MVEALLIDVHELLKAANESDKQARYLPNVVQRKRQTRSGCCFTALGGDPCFLNARVCATGTFVHRFRPHSWRCVHCTIDWCLPWYVMQST